NLDVALEGLRVAEDVDDDRVVDDEVGGRERVDLGGVAAELRHGLTHRGQVHDAGHAGEVLHEHAPGGELDLDLRLGLRVPGGERPHVVGGDVRAVLGAQQVLGEDLQAVGQPIQSLDRVQAVDLVVLFAHRE